ncbi:MAG: ATP synthase F0 subunit C [Bdellovibrionales bacterium]|nr:ATP synthase F0 subunit C [Bdellovibrionales bacterium]
MIKRSTVIGFFASLFVVCVTGVVFAAEGEVPRPDLTENVKMYLALAAGLGMGLASAGGALGQGKAIASAMEGIARNPGAQNKIFVPMIVGLALVESLVIFSLVIALQLAGKI